MKTKIKINKDGVIEFIYRDELRGLVQQGESSIKRVSHVEPTPDCQWLATMIDGPVLGPFSTREEALQAELKWLRENKGL